MPIDAGLKAEVVSLNNKVSALWSAELLSTTAKMQAVADAYPVIGRTGEQWIESSRPVIPGVRYYRPNPQYVPLSGAEHALRDHYMRLSVPAELNLYEHGPLFPPETPPMIQAQMESVAGRRKLSDIRLPNASTELKSAADEWNQLSKRHNEQLSDLRYKAMFHEVAAFGLAQAANYALDRFAFDGTSKGLRTNAIDIGSLALFWLPYGTPYLRAGAAVALHCGARVWDRYDQRSRQ